MTRYLSSAILAGSLIAGLQVQAATCEVVYREKFDEAYKKVSSEYEVRRDRENHRENITVGITGTAGAIGGGLILGSAAGGASGGLSSVAGGAAGALAGGTLGAAFGAFSLSDTGYSGDSIASVSNGADEVSYLFKLAEEGDSLTLRSVHRSLFDDFFIKVRFEDMVAVLRDINLTCGQGQNLEMRSQREVLGLAVPLLKARGAIRD